MHAGGAERVRFVCGESLAGVAAVSRAGRRVPGAVIFFAVLCVIILYGFKV